MTNDELERGKLLAFINETPILLSLLYDLDLMPEQSPEGSTAREDMYNIAAHFKAALAERPPSGEMVLVPREPTENMIIAGRRFCATDSIFVINFYRAMLSAYEKQP